MTTTTPKTHTTRLPFPLDPTSPDCSVEQLINGLAAELCMYALLMETPRPAEEPDDIPDPPPGGEDEEDDDEED